MTYEDYKLLFEQNDDNINSDVLDILYMKKRNKVLGVHPYTITAPPQGSKSRRWTTYVKTKEGKRKQIAKGSEKDLYETLYDFYFSNNQVITIESMYPDFEKTKKEVSDATIEKHKQHWRKFYSSSNLVTTPLHKITAEQLEDFFHSCIKEYGLTRKDLGNMLKIAKDILKLAKKRKEILYNPFDEVEISTHLCKPVKKKKPETQVYLPDERKKLFAALQAEIKKFPNLSQAYAILLLFKLGLRIGELVALKITDIDFNSKTIHIQRTQTAKYDANGNLRPAIVDHVKKKSEHGDRFLDLSDYDISLIKKVLSINLKNGFYDDDFLFLNEDGRISIRTVDYRIRKLCKSAKIDEKSAHDIRRSCASELFSKNVSLTTISDMLGHSDLEVTRKYVFDNKSAKDRAKLITTSLQSFDCPNVV